MKKRKTAPARRRISFAVDREEIDISTDWVQAVMSGPGVSPGSRAGSGGLGASLLNSATGEEVSTEADISTVEKCTSVEKHASVENTAPVEDSAAVVEETPVLQTATVEQLATVAPDTTGTATDFTVLTVVDSAPVAAFATDELSATPSDAISTEDHSVDAGVEGVAAEAGGVAAEAGGGLASRPVPLATGVAGGPVALEGLGGVASGSTAPVEGAGGVRRWPAASEDGREGEGLELAPEPLRAGLLRKPRPKPIRRITDGLTPGQYAVYSLMYDAGEPAADGVRIYRGGYADLCRLTGLSKRGIQNIVGELQEKTVLSIHQAPGYHRTETSAYRVPEAAEVLKLWFSSGLRFALGKSKRLSASGEVA